MTKLTFTFVNITFISVNSNGNMKYPVNDEQIMFKFPGKSEPNRSYWLSLLVNLQKLTWCTALCGKHSGLYNNNNNNNNNNLVRMRNWAREGNKLFWTLPAVHCCSCCWVQVGKCGQFCIGIRPTVIRTWLKAPILTVVQ